MSGSEREAPLAEGASRREGVDVGAGEARESTPPSASAESAGEREEGAAPSAAPSSLEMKGVSPAAKALPQRMRAAACTAVCVS